MEIAVSLWAIISFAIAKGPNTSIEILKLNHIANTVAAFVNFLIVSPMITLMNSGDN